MRRARRLLSRSPSSPRRDRARLPRAAARRAAHARPAGHADRPGLEPGRHRRAGRQPRDERDRAGRDPAVRHAARLPARPRRFPRSRARRHADRAADRAAAGGRRDRADRRLRPPRAARRHVLALGIDVSFNKAAVVLAVTFVVRPALRAPGDRRLRGDRPPLVDASRTLGAGPVADVRARRPAARERRARRRHRALARARARRVRRDDHVRRQPRRASPRPSRSRSTRSSTATSTSR